MSEIAELDPLGFHRILHAVLRANETPEEVARATEVMNWVCRNLHILRRVLEASQARLFNVIFQHFIKHNIPTNRTYTGEMVRNEDQPDGMVAILEDYDENLPNLQTVTTALDMPQVMADRIADWERVTMLDALDQAKRITVGLAAPKKGTEERPKGARDAAGYLFDALHTGVIVSDTRTVGGSVKKNLPDIMAIHEINRQEALTDRLTIRTQLSCLDKAIRGFRKPELIGVLGYAGNFKTTLCRTFVYNAALQGFRFVHVPLESSYDEELMLYGIMHAHSPDFKRHNMTGINRQKFEDGKMTVEEIAFLTDWVIPDFQSNIKGDVIICQPTKGTWAEVKQIIETEDRERPIDGFLIDYLALMDVSESRNPIAAINETIKQVKNFCLTFRGGEGLCGITPVQGKREGYDQAKGNGGQWESDGVYMYSECEKSVDKLIYVYTDDELKGRNNAKVGVCKSRRSIDAAPCLVARHPNSGRITDPVLSGSGQEEKWIVGETLEKGW
jgi:hypothetical protein